MILAPGLVQTLLSVASRVCERNWPETHSHSLLEVLVSDSWTSCLPSLLWLLNSLSTLPTFKAIVTNRRNQSKQISRWSPYTQFRACKAKSSWAKAPQATCNALLSIKSDELSRVHQTKFLSHMILIKFAASSFMHHEDLHREGCYFYPLQS